MNITKNIHYLKMEERIIDEISITHTEDSSKKIRKRYEELKNKINSIVDDWIKIAGEDYYLFKNIDMNCYILVPDTHKIRSTCWNFQAGLTYEGAFKYVHGCSESLKTALAKDVAIYEGILPSPFEKELLGLPAYGLSLDMARNIFQHSLCPLLNKEKSLTMMAGVQVKNVIVIYRGEYYCYDIATNKITCANIDNVAAKISVCNFDVNENLFDIAERYGIFPDLLTKDEIQDMKRFVSIYKDNIKVEDTEEFAAYVEKHHLEEQLENSEESDEVLEKDQNTVKLTD